MEWSKSNVEGGLPGGDGTRKLGILTPVPHHVLTCRSSCQSGRGLSIQASVSAQIMPLCAVAVLAVHMHTTQLTYPTSRPTAYRHQGESAKSKMPTWQPRASLLPRDSAAAPRKSLNCMALPRYNESLCVETNNIGTLQTGLLPWQIKGANSVNSPTPPRSSALALKLGHLLLPSKPRSGLEPSCLFELCTHVSRLRRLPIVYHVCSHCCFRFSRARRCDVLFGIRLCHSAIMAIRQSLSRRSSCHPMHAGWVRQTHLPHHLIPPSLSLLLLRGHT